MGVISVKVILPPSKYSSILASKFWVITYEGIYASDSVFSGKIVAIYFFVTLTLFNVLTFKISVEFIDKFQGFGYFKFTFKRKSSRFFSIILNSIL
jgi:hypothetical protein